MLFRSSGGSLDRLMSYAQRNLTNDDFAALSALATQARSAAGCGDASVRTGKASKAVLAYASDKGKAEKTAKTKSHDLRSAGHDSR